MLRRGTCILYEKNHTLLVHQGGISSENRCLNITITDFSDFLEVKVRDVSDYVFNFCTKIDVSNFEVIKSEQSLDIDFREFKLNLIDMLQQVNNHEMFLKGETEMNRCKLVFYGKSKIKSIVYLIIELQATNQQEIFSEMNKTILELQAINKNVSSQLQITKRLLHDKDFEIEKCANVGKQLEKRFIEELQHLNGFFSKKMQQSSAQLIHRILILSQKLLKLTRDVEIVKAEALLKSDSSARLLQSMENLRLESLESTQILNELKRENCNLKNLQFSNEKTIVELNRTIQQQSNDYIELNRLKDELEKDVKQATMIIAQKTTANEELAKDVVQANQMLVNFNHLFDNKNKEIEELNNSILVKDKMIQEQKLNFQKLLHELNDYRTQFNEEQFEKMEQELFATNKRIEEVEKTNRETIKLNELLTRKLASGDFAHRNYH